MTIRIAAKIVILGETLIRQRQIAMPKTMTINTSVASQKTWCSFSMIISPFLVVVMF